MWEADPQSATASSADSRSQNFEPPQVSLVYPHGSMVISLSIRTQLLMCILQNLQTTIRGWAMALKTSSLKALSSPAL